MLGNYKAILFVIVLCCVCSSLLLLAFTALQPFHERNRLNEQHRHILIAAGLVKSTAQLSRIDSEKLFSDHIRRSATFDKLLLFNIVTDNNHIIGFVMPFAIQGVWGEIQGYIGVQSDKNTILGFTVSRHSETPGLGAEIQSAAFSDNFVGKHLRDHEGMMVGIMVSKGHVHDLLLSESRANYVDGITGATLTGKAITLGFKSLVTKYESFLNEKSVK